MKPYVNACQVKGWRARQFFYPPGEAPLVESLDARCRAMAERAQRRVGRGPRRRLSAAAAAAGLVLGKTKTSRREFFAQLGGLLAVYVFIKTALGAPSAAAILNVRTDGDENLNGGWFDPTPGGRPTNLNATSATGNAPVVTSATYNFIARDVGHLLFVLTGTNWTPGYYPIVSVSAGAATLDASIGAACDLQGNPNTVAGVATVASPTNATWSVNYVRTAAAGISYTDMVIGGTTTQFTSVANPVGPNLVGNAISITAGTGFTVQRVIVSSTSGTTATCSASLGTGGSTGGVGGLGGSLASPGKAFSLAVNTNTIFIKAGTYSITSTTANVAGGRIDTGGQAFVTAGYGTMWGDDAAPAVLQASGIASVTLMIASQPVAVTRNITFDGANLTGIRGTDCAGNFYKVGAINCKNYGFSGITGQCFYMACFASNCTNAAFGIHQGQSYLIGCEAWANPSPGFYINSSNTRLDECLSYGNTGAATGYGFLYNGSLNVCNMCTAYGNAEDGFRAVNSGNMAVNCISESNTVNGFYITGSNTQNLINNAAFGNGTNYLNNATFNVSIHNFILTGSAFTNAAGGVFELNNTAGAGAVCRAAGLQGTFPRGLTRSYLSLGAAQLPASTGGCGATACIQ